MAQGLQEAVEQRLAASYEQREAIQDCAQTAMEQRAELQKSLAATTQELRTHKDIQPAGPADAAQPILPEVDWVVTSSHICMRPQSIVSYISCNMTKALAKAHVQSFWNVVLFAKLLSLSQCHSAMRRCDSDRRVGVTSIDKMICAMQCLARYTMGASRPIASGLAPRQRV